MFDGIVYVESHKQLIPSPVAVRAGVCNFVFMHLFIHCIYYIGLVICDREKAPEDALLKEYIDINTKW